MQYGVYCILNVNIIPQVEIEDAKRLLPKRDECSKWLYHRNWSQIAFSNVQQQNRRAGKIIEIFIRPKRFTVTRKRGNTEKRDQQNRRAAT